MKKSTFLRIAFGVLLITLPSRLHAESGTPRPTETLTLPLPDSLTVTEACRAISTEDLASGATVALDRSFLDDFDGGLDPRWVLHFDRPGNTAAAHTHDNSGEQEVYVDKAFAGTGSEPLGLDPFTISGGVLTIRAWRTPGALKSALYEPPYVSGMLNSMNYFTQEYGYFEIAAKLPTGNVVWPGFWLVPSQHPVPPEIDVFELVGKKPQAIYQTTHWQYPDGHAECKTDLDDPSAAFHLYGALLTPNISSTTSTGCRSGLLPRPPP
jgi:hypothetical protein